jgi:hypothetical protein
VYESPLGWWGVGVLAAASTPVVVGVLRLGDGALRDLEASSQLRLADGIGVMQLVQADLLQSLGPLGRQPLLAATRS